MNQPFLLEIGVEELPARHCMRIIEQLPESTIQKIASEHNLSLDTPMLFLTPRRIAIVADSISQTQTANEIKGPLAEIAFTDGKPNSIAEKFAASQGIPITSLQQKEVNGKTYLFVTQNLSQNIDRDIQAFATSILSSLSFPKSMRWDYSGVRFSRPIRWITCMIGTHVQPITLFGLIASNTTYGPRFSGSPPITIPTAAEYDTTLLPHKVIVDHRTRRTIIENAIETLREKEKLDVFDPRNELLDETVFLTERPQPLVCSFDKKFLSLPPEVVQTVLHHTQKSFPLQTSADHQLTNSFLVIANYDGPSLLITQGNEKVVRARLNDAIFFFEQDKKHTLKEFSNKADTITFQERLGSMQDKSERLLKIATLLQSVFKLDEATLKNAALLAKADLATTVVTELPSLEGSIGRMYAAREGIDTEVALALEDYYHPRFSDDTLPETKLGTTLALVDRIDTLYGLFSIGYKPTGSSDPYGMRRAAIGILRILWEKEIPLHLTDLIEAAQTAYLSSDRAPSPETEKNVETALTKFLLSRLEQYLKDLKTDLSTNVIRSIVYNTQSSFVYKKQLLLEFKKLANSPEFTQLTELAKRTYNIAIKGKSHEQFTIDTATLNETEREFNECINRLAQKDFISFSDLSSLVGPGTQFFEGNLIMAEDKSERARRLEILRGAHVQISRVFNIEYLLS